MAALAAAFVMAGPAASVAAPPAGLTPSLAAFLRQKLAAEDDDPAALAATRVAVAWVDLAGDGLEEALVYVGGDDWCGSGGCRLMVLQPQGAGFRIRANTSITWSPIGVLVTRSHGWRDITVTYAGGGVIPGYVAVLRFNGARYPDDPNPPVPRLRRGQKPMIVISDKDAGVPLPPALKPPPAR